MDSSRSSILRISDEKTLELIELYKKEACLWNTELSSYKNRAKRAAAAERIARKLAIYKFDSRLVAIKFKNLRNSYCQELKKIAYSYTVGDDDPYKPKVFWFSKMDSFLRPHLQQTCSLNAGQHEDKEEFLTDEPAEELVQLSNPEDVLMESSDEEEKTKALKKRPRSSASRNHRDDSNVNLVKKHSMDDCFDSFGKYVSSMLKTMPQHKAMELQPKIVSLLTSVDFEDRDEHVSQSDEAK